MYFDGSSSIAFSGVGMPSGGADRTIVAWLRTSTLAVREWPIYSGSEASYKRFNLDLRGDVDDTLRVGYFASAMTSTNTPSANTWFHVAFFIQSSGANVGMYYNGGSIQSAAVSGGTMNTDTDFIQAGAGAGASLANPWTGDVAELAVYNVRLDQVDCTALTKGLCPKRVRPGKLVFYAPLHGDRTAPETVASSVTIYGTPTAGEHPRIYR